jgi:hypothetical protein
MPSGIGRPAGIGQQQLAAGAITTRQAPDPAPPAGAFTSLPGQINPTAFLTALVTLPRHHQTVTRDRNFVHRAAGHVPTNGAADPPDARQAIARKSAATALGHRAARAPNTLGMADEPDWAICAGPPMLTAQESDAPIRHRSGTTSCS